MDVTFFQVVIVLGLMLVCVFAGGWLGFGLAKNPSWADNLNTVQDAVMPWILQGIIMAFKASEIHFDETQADGSPERLGGNAKRKIAMSMYDMLPGQIGPFNIDTLKLNGIITPEIFEGWIEHAYELVKSQTELYVSDQKNQEEKIKA